MRREASVVVVGGGVIGLTVASLLADKVPGLDITVVDRGPRPEPGDDLELRVSAIAPGSIELLSSVGAWTEAQPEHRCAYDRMRVWDASD